MRHATLFPAALAAGLLLSAAGSASAASQPKHWTAPVAPTGSGLSARDDNREVAALNWLEAKGYRDFGAVKPVGRDFQITALKNGKLTTVMVDPQTGEIIGG